jgi:SAM-dependent methyltransferase
MNASIKVPRSRPLLLIRHVIKRVLIRLDLIVHANDPSIKRWRPVLARPGALDCVSPGFITPSKALVHIRVHAEDLFQHGLARPGDRVLDVGAGNGRLAIGLLELGVSSYVGLDIDRRTVDLANRDFADYENVHFDVLDVYNPMYNPKGSVLPEQVVFPYPDEAFECVAAWSLYTHLERIEVVARYVSETARVLCAGGGALMTFFRSPPNALSSTAHRSVFTESDILRTVGTHFEVEHTSGGSGSDFHDQWRLYLRKK